MLRARGAEDERYRRSAAPREAHAFKAADRSRTNSKTRATSVPTSSQSRTSSVKPQVTIRKSRESSEVRRNGSKPKQSCDAEGMRKQMNALPTPTWAPKVEMSQGQTPDEYVAAYEKAMQEKMNLEHQAIARQYEQQLSQKMQQERDETARCRKQMEQDNQAQVNELRAQVQTSLNQQKQAETQMQKILQQEKDQKDRENALAIQQREMELRNQFEKDRKADEERNTRMLDQQRSQQCVSNQTVQESANIAARKQDEILNSHQSEIRRLQAEMDKKNRELEMAKQQAHQSEYDKHNKNPRRYCLQCPSRRKTFGDFSFLHPAQPTRRDDGDI